MNRRKFIGVSGLGVIGTNSLVSTVSNILGFSFEDKIFDFFSFIGVSQTGKIDELNDKITVIHKLNDWLKSNYTLCDDNLYWKAGDNRLLIPLQLKTVDGELFDHVVLVFNHYEGNIAQYTGNLSGFHLETILRNKKLLSKLGDVNKIRNSVLPSSGKGKPVDLGWSFETDLGNFELSASLIEGKTSISSALYVDDDAVWQNSFLSESALNHSIANTI